MEKTYVRICIEKTDGGDGGKIKTEMSGTTVDILYMLVEATAHAICLGRRRSIEEAVAEIGVHITERAKQIDAQQHDEGDNEDA